MSSFWYSGTSFKKSDDNLRKEADRLYVEWDTPLNENHLLNKCEMHGKVVNKFDNADDKGSRNVMTVEKKRFDGVDKFAFKFQMGAHGGAT